MRWYQVVCVCLVACWLIGFAAAPSPGSASPNASPARAAFDVGPVSALRFHARLFYVGTRAGEVYRIEPQAEPVALPPLPRPAPIVEFAVDGRGVVWAATDGAGLAAFDGGAWAIHTPSDSFPSLNVRGVALDDHDRVWAATDAGLACLQDGEWRVYNTLNSPLVSDDLTSIVAGYEVWAGSPNGLSKWSSGRWTTYQSTNSGLPDNRVRALAWTPSHLWVGTELGLARTDGSTWMVAPEVTGPVSGVAPDAAGDLWLNLSGRVARLSSCDWEPDAVRAEPEPITSFAIGPGDEVWVGTGQGVQRVDARQSLGEWRAMPIRQPVRALAFGAGSVWAATEGQVTRWSLPNLKATRFRGLRGEPRAALVDEGGQTWVATWGDGVARLSGSEWVNFTTQNSDLPSDYVAALVRDSNGQVWAGTGDGVARWSGDQVEAFGAAAIGLRAGPVVALAAASDGRVWAGSYGGGLASWDPAGRKWQVYHTGDSDLPTDYIQSLAVDPSGAVWMGTAGAGVVRFDGEGFRSYRAGGDGPADDFVTSLAIDGEGRLWVDGDAGDLAEFDGCRWTHFPAESRDLSVNALVTAGDQVFVGSNRGLFAFSAPPPPRSQPVAALLLSPRETPVRVAAPRRSSVQAQAGADRWVNYPVGRSVHAITALGDFVWAATLNGGALRWRPEDGSFTRFVYPQDGIASNRVVFVTADSRGRVWLGTQDAGLSIFDGRSWTAYSTRNSALPNDYVNGIAFDSSGRAWLATLGGGVAAFDGRHWTTYTRDSSGLAGDWVWFVAVDGEDRVWAGTTDGLSYLDGERWVAVPDTSNVHCIAFHDGVVWFGDGNGLNRVENGKAVEIAAGSNPAWTRDVYSIAFDGQGTAWLGAQNGIFRYRGGEFEQVSIAATGLEGSQVYATAVDGQGRIWIGTDREDGLASFDGTIWRTYSTTTGANPASLAVHDIFEDSARRMWFATDGGVSLFDGQAWLAYSARNSGLLSNAVNVVRQDARGRMWFGTDAGLNVFDGDRWEAFTAETSGLPDNGVQAIAFDREGRAWIGSREGLTVFDGRQWEVQDIRLDGDRFNAIVEMAFDRAGRLWLVSSSWPDVVMLDRGRVRRFTRDDHGLATFSLASIRVDPRGRVWLGSFDGASVFDGRRWRAFSTTGQGLTVSSAYSLGFDRKGDLWAGGYGGLLRLHENTWREYLYGETPLVSNFVSALAVDSEDRIWIGTSEGGVSELIPGAEPPPRPPTPTATAIPTAILPPTPQPPPTQTPEPVSPTAEPMPPVTPQAVAPRFQAIWQDVYGGDRGGMQYAVNAARQVWCAEQRYERGVMFWRNNEPQPGTIYVMTYADGSMDAGEWQAFPDTWDSNQPPGSGLTPPPGLLEPVRGFGKVWRERLGGAAVPPPIGWATEAEQGSDQALYQDFLGGTMLYSPRLNLIFVLKFDGSWRSFPG